MKKEMEVGAGYHKVVIDTSEEACAKFGFVPGQVVFHAGNKGVVVGVGPDVMHSIPRLWVEFEFNDGKEILWAWPEALETI